jgi:Uma2 family endonuclease
MGDASRKAGAVRTTGGRSVGMANEPKQGSPPRVTSAELLALPEERRLEVIAGRMEEKAAPSGEHSHLQVQLGGLIGRRFGRHGSDRPGGWWIYSEADLELGPEDLVRPDLAGWRREKVPEAPRGRPIRDIPDWICEIVSPSNALRDRVEKLRLYHRAGVGHYWLLEPEEATLTVLKHEPDGYKIVHVASGAERIRATPFEQVEFSVEELLGDDPAP